MRDEEGNALRTLLVHTVRNFTTHAHPPHVLYTSAMFFSTNDPHDQIGHAHARSVSG